MTDQPTTTDQRGPRSGGTVERGVVVPGRRVVFASAVRDEDGGLADGLAVAAPALRRHFDGFCLRVTTSTHPSTIAAMRELGATVVFSAADLTTVGRQRRGAVADALDVATTVMVGDADHVVRWVLADEVEFADVLARACSVDCLIVGRHVGAGDEAPRALRESERLINQAFAALTGHSWDVLSSVRVLSEKAARLVVTDSTVDTIATDVDWPLLCLRAGLVVDYHRSDVLNYREGTRHDAAPADPDALGSARSWVLRLRIAGWMADAMGQYAATPSSSTHASQRWATLRDLWLAETAQELDADPRVLGWGMVGSFARGDADAWSDLDLLVVVHDDDFGSFTAATTDGYWSRAECWIDARRNVPAGATSIASMHIRDGLPIGVDWYVYPAAMAAWPDDCRVMRGNAAVPAAGASFEAWNGRPPRQPPRAGAGAPSTEVQLMMALVAAKYIARRAPDAAALLDLVGAAPAHQEPTEQLRALRDRVVELGGEHPSPIASAVLAYLNLVDDHTS